MKRLIVFTLIMSLAWSSMAFAGESLRQSAARVADAAARSEAASRATVSSRDRAAASLKSSATAPAARSFAAAVQETPAVSKSGMSKRTKLMIYAAIGVGFAAAAWSIDHHVLDITPSSLGTRQD